MPSMVSELRRMLTVTTELYNARSIAEFHDLLQWFVEIEARRTVPPAFARLVAIAVCADKITLIGFTSALLLVLIYKSIASQGEVIHSIT